MQVPCGKCPECVKRRTSGWSFRLMQEEKVSQSAHFITLTYDTKRVPLTGNGFMSINKRDVQLFFKRLRKLNPAKIKYYVVGEYGGKTNRPHYHAILFNVDITTIQPAWQNGSVHYGTVSGASIGYTLKYMSKRGRIPMHRNDDRVPEFGLMSKGLGASYLTPAMVNWHKVVLDCRMYCNIEGNKKISMPRYYKDKIYDEQERKRIAFFARQKMVADQLKREQEGGDNYWRDKAEKDMESFRNQKKNSTKGESL